MVILCLIVFAVSVFGIVGTLLKANREKSTFDDLIEMAEADVGVEQRNIDSDAAAEMETTEASEAGQTNSDHTGGVMEEKPKRNYGLLKEKNPDFAGWLRIGASAVILSPIASQERPQYRGLEEVTKEEDTYLRIFGKPFTRVNRRMGVVLCYAPLDADLDALRDKAKRIAEKVEVY